MKERFKLAIHTPSFFFAYETHKVHEVWPNAEVPHILHARPADVYDGVFGDMRLQLHGQKGRNIQYKLPKSSSS